MTKEQISGIIGAIISCFLLLLILFSIKYHFTRQAEVLSGIPVMFGNVPDAGGNEESVMTEVIPEPSQPTVTQSIPKNIPEPPIATQDRYQSLAVKEQNEAERARIAEERRIQEETARKQREQETQSRKINQQMSGLFGESTSGSRGNTEGTGTQGVSTGNSTQGATSGVGGTGKYDLGGRGLGSGGLILPQYTVNEYGTVVVTITVDPKGNVINAEIGRGTNTPSATLRNEALRAARSTKFESIQSTNNQQGTITYKFNLR